MPRLVTALAPGQTVDRWQLSATREERFDVPDEPMEGSMDAGFFLTGERNYIPHEYPCRRAFAALHRERRPEPRSRFTPGRWWFPFGATRVDLSGFWFRPTRVETWARTCLVADHDQACRFRLTTCGAAMLFADGREVAWLAPYRRNWEEVVDFDLPLPAGETEITVWFADLCERDARYFFSLQILEGDGVAAGLRVPIEPEAVREMEALLDGVHFDRPWYEAGEVVLRFDRPTSRSFEVGITVTGDFISAEVTHLERHLEYGQDEVVVAPVDKLPADFRTFRITLRAGEVTASRALGVEIAPPPPAPPGSLPLRVQEALDHVALNAEPDTVRALARVATGRRGPETDAMIEACLPAIADCHDCADFLLVPLLWARMRWGDGIGRETRARVDDAILGFRYWMDEPGNDVMWYFSENHALLFHAACHLAGTLFPEARFTRSGRLGSAQRQIGAERVRRWFDHFEACEMAEWNSAPYFPIDLKGLAALQALSPEADIRERAERAIRRLLAIVAASCHRGILTASQGRSYEHSLRPARTLEVTAIGRLVWGHGGLGRRFHALPLLALCIRDHGWRPAENLRDVAVFAEDGAREWCFRQGEGGFASLYHYKTRHFAIGSVAAYKPGGWGYQETVLHMRLGEQPEAQVWINHPGETLQGGFGRPSFWGGCGILPRVHQYRALAVLVFDAHPDTPDFTHAYVPQAAFDEVIAEDNRLWLRAGGAFALLAASGPIERIERGPSAGCEVRLAGRHGHWIVRLSDVSRDASLAGFAARMQRLEMRQTADGGIVLDDPDYGTVVCHASGIVEAEERLVDPSLWTREGGVRALP
jgi:hypothetical protein